MSELAQEYPLSHEPAPYYDNAPAPETHHQASIHQLADKLDYINPAVIGPARIESERRLVALRRSWLEHADACMKSGEFGSAISCMKYVIEDIDHSGDHTHLEEAKRVLESCRDEQLRAAGYCAIISAGILSPRSS